MIGREIGHFLVGMMFLTRLPVPAGLIFSEGRLARAARYFPLVGILVGLISGGIYFVSCQYLAPSLAGFLAVIMGIFVTGALHEDGLADCCDGLGGGHTRERSLEIMRDSRIGTYGTCALIGSIGLRALAIGGMGAYEGFIALIIAHGLSRGLIPLVLVSGKYARTRGLASSVSNGVRGWEAFLSVAIAAVLVLLAGPNVGLVTFAAAVVGGGLMLTILVRRLGGYTGDGLGAVQQIAEIASLMTLSVFFV